MAIYQYTVILPSGKEKKALIEAESEKHARSKIKSGGEILISIKAYHESSAKKAFKKLEQWKYRISHAELSLATRQLATLISSGIVLEQALEALIEQAEKEKIKALFLSVRAKVMQGSTLAKALAEFPQAFSALYVATVAAGEKSGHLDIVLENLAAYVDKQKRLKQQVYGALLYPLLMTLVSSSIVFFLLIYVVPKMVNVFVENKQQLPLATSILIYISHFLQHYGVLFVLIIMVMISVFVYFYKRKLNVKKIVHQLLSKTPLIKKLINQINTSRFARTFGILLNAGVPASDAMRVSSDVISHIPINEKVRIARTQVIEGASIHRSLKATNTFPAMSMHLITSGEKSGQLATMLLRAADNQDYDVEQLIKSLLTLFEPMLILIMGSIVLFIVLAILLPIFSINQMV